MQSKVNLLFPIEIMNRELDFRLFLAGYCARPNNRIFIGHTDAVYRVIQSSRGGLYVGKNIRPPRLPGQGTTMEERHTVLKERGFKLVNLDEEGGVMAGDEERWKDWLNKRLDVCYLETDDHVCAWGDYQAQYYKSLNPACAGNIQTTGHPRFDLYKPKHRAFYDEDVAKLKNQYGDFVLVNTNFALSNNRSGTKASFSRRFYYDDPRDAQKRLDHVTHWSHIWHITVEFVKLVTRLSIEMPHLNYVIRPHPSENTAFYKTIFNGVPNVHIVHEGSVGPWLLAAKALIHDGCTTAIESHFCSTPIINYKSVQDERYDLMLPNLFGARCTDESEVLAELNRILNKQTGETTTGNNGLNDVARSLIHNFEHDSYAQFSEAVLRVAETVEPSEMDVSRMGRRAKYDRLRENVRVRFGQGSSDNAKGRLDKFYGFENANIDAKMWAMQQILNKEVRYTVHSSRLMSVEC